MQGYKTIAFNTIMAIVAIIKTFSPEAELPADHDITQHFDAVWVAINTITIAGNAILRFFTKSAIFKKAKK